MNRIEKKINFRNIILLIIILIIILIVLFSLLIYLNYDKLSGNKNESKSSKTNESHINNNYNNKEEDKIVKPKKVTIDTFIYDSVIRMNDNDIEYIESNDFDDKKVEKLIIDRFIKNNEKKASFYYNRVYNSTKKRLRVKNYLATIIKNLSKEYYDKLKIKIGHSETVSGGQNLKNVSIFIDKILKELAANKKKYLKD